MRKSRGFTLVDLLIIVAIILIIAALAIPNPKKSGAKKQTQASADANKPDSMGNGGWYAAQGTVRGVYVNDGIWNIVFEGDDHSVFTIPLTNGYPHYAPPIAAGEHVRLEFGGRAQGPDSAFTSYKVFRLPVPKVEAAHVESLSCQCVHTCVTERQAPRVHRFRRHRKRVRHNPNSPVGNPYGSGTD